MCFFTVGGTLDKSAKSYVKRAADHQLYDTLNRKKYCYVLNARQMGKSSLIIRTSSKLTITFGYFCLLAFLRGNESFKLLFYVILFQKWKAPISNICITIDLTGMTDKNISQNNFYFGFIQEIIKQSNLDFNLNEWWNNEAQNLSSVQKLNHFVLYILLKKVSKNIFIFVDEIDSILPLEYRSQFFALIRFFAIHRADQPALNRLTFCLLGVAAPWELLQDEKITSFNIGEKIDLKGFNENEVKPLTEGLKIEKVETPELVMKEIIYWTGGQPFLTQKLCSLVTQEKGTFNIEQLSYLIEGKILNNWVNNDPNEHFKTIQKRIMKCGKALALIDLYQVIRAGQTIKFNSDVENQLELKLSGLVKEEDGKLKVYNPIYEKIFDNNWIEEKRREVIFYGKEFSNWKEYEEIRQRYLLTGEKFYKAWKRKEEMKKQNKNPEGDESDYLHECDKLWDKVKGKFPDYSDITLEEVINLMNFWTGGVAIFNEFFFEIVTQFDLEITNNSLQTNSVDNFFETAIIPKIQKSTTNQEVQDKIETMKKNLLENISYDSFWLLLTYERFLDFSRVDAENSIEQPENSNVNINLEEQQEQLIKIGLLINKEGKVMIVNEIYKWIFNHNWIKESIKKTRPYALKLYNWIKSKFEDNHELLKENQLEESLNWVYNKNLKEPEKNFIISSLVWEIWQCYGDSDLEKKKFSAVDLIKKFFPKLQGKTDDVYGIIKVTLKWTKVDPFLLDNLLQLLDNSQDELTTYADAENLVRSQINKNWDNSRLQEQCKLIETQLINDKSFWLLITYRQILLNKTIEFSSEQERQDLRNLKLVLTNKNNQLEVANEFYKNKFHLDWILEKLKENNIPNIENLLAWLDSEQFINHISILKDKFSNNFKQIIQQIVLWTYQENKFLVTIEKIVQFIESHPIESESEQWFKENIIFSPKLGELLEAQEFKIFIKNLISINLLELRNESYDFIYQSLEKLITNHINSLMIAETIISITQGKTEQIGKIVDRICQDNSLITNQDSLITVKEKIKIINDEINSVCDKIDLTKIEENPMETPKLTLEERNLDELLDYIVNRARDIETIFLVKLSDHETTIEYWNRALQLSNPELYKKLIGRNGRSSELLDYFACLKMIPNDYKKFGNQIKVNKRSGELNCLIFNFPEQLKDEEKQAYKRENKELAERQLIVSFTEILGTNYGICYLSKDDIPISRFLGKVEKTFDIIKSTLVKEVEFL